MRNMISTPITLTPCFNDRRKLTKEESMATNALPDLSKDEVLPLLEKILTKEDIDDLFDAKDDQSLDKTITAITEDVQELRDMTEGYVTGFNRFFVMLGDLGFSNSVRDSLIKYEMIDVSLLSIGNRGLDEAVTKNFANCYLKQSPWHQANAQIPVEAMQGITDEDMVEFQFYSTLHTSLSYYRWSGAPFLTGMKDAIEAFERENNPQPAKYFSAVEVVLARIPEEKRYAATASNT